jgi:2-methylcitrate dehydratase PrpD
MIDFILNTRYSDLSGGVHDHLDKALLDNIVAMIAGSTTPTVRIIKAFAERTFSGRDATVVGTGNRLNAPGAALVNACSANALDIDDGFRPSKGHPGATVIPAALAQAEALDAPGDRFLSAVVVGYEIAMRASVAWHTHVHRGPSYHGSGSWGSLGAAAACAHLMELSPEQTEMALGIAEYHAPIAPIMTCVEHPAMVKDGIQWGALVGITAAHLAAEGFTGIPGILAQADQSERMSTLGKEWWIGRLYYKFYPCCRWAQPPIAGVLKLRAEHGLDAAQIDSVEINTFDAATHLTTRRPSNTEEAQYSLPYPVACALVRGKVGIQEITQLDDPEILALSDRIRMSVDQELESRFPTEALARVTIRTTDDRKLAIGPVAAPGDTKVTFGDLLEKSSTLLGSEKAGELADLIRNCPQSTTLNQIAKSLNA